MAGESYKMISLVKGVGPLDAKIVIVGEAPGSIEQSRGIPFVGSSGELLDRLLASAGIVRNFCYLTNVIKEKPPYNDITKFIDLGFKNKIRISEEYYTYYKYLVDELDKLSPNIIVAVGKTALYALTGYTHITKYRGSILIANKDFNNRKVIPIIHPAAALRNINYKYMILYDLIRIERESKFPEVNLPKRDIFLRPSFDESLIYIENLANHERISIDIEVVNKEVSCIGFSTGSNNAFVIPFTDYGKDYFTVTQEAEIWLAIESILKNSKIEKLGQNIMFDASFLLNRFSIKIKNMHDTMLAQQCLQPDLPKGLDFLCSLYTDEPYYKDEGKEAFKGVIKDQEQFWRYNGKDCAVLFDIFPKQEELLKSFGNWDTYTHMMSMLRPLLYIQELGIKIDTENTDQESTRLNNEIKRRKLELFEIAGVNLNPHSPKQLKEYFYGTLKFPPYRKTVGGKSRVSTDADALKRLARKGCREASLVGEIRSLTKMKSTYIDMDFGADNRIHCNFGFATTGRLRSSQTIFGTGGNLQNLPATFKKYMLIDTGYLGIFIDLVQAENRIIAYCAPDTVMRRAFEQDIDIHSQTAAMLFSTAVENISNAPGSSELGDGSKSQRYFGKQANHALNYGLGYKRFSLRLEIPEAQGKFLVERYHQVYPGVRGNYHKWIQGALSEDRCVINPYGRKRKFLGYWGEDIFKEAYAFFPQSTVADKINRDGILYIWTNKEKFPTSQLLNQVHDSIDFQLALSEGAQSIAQQILWICESLQTPIPWKDPFSIPVEVKIGFDFSSENCLELDISKSVSVLAEDIERFIKE